MRPLLKIFAVALLAVPTMFCITSESAAQTVTPAAYAEEQNAVLGRGLVALPQGDDGIFLSWRLLPSDPEGAVFKIYRREQGDGLTHFEVIAETEVTSYVDGDLAIGRRYSYAVSANASDQEGDRSTPVQVEFMEGRQDYMAFDIGENYGQARVVTGDITGDGELEIVVQHSPNKNIDPWGKAWKKSEHSLRVTTFRRTGERMWSFDLGRGIESGAFYAPIVVWDVDADGRAEILLKTNKSDDRLNYDADRLTILNGETGKVKAEVPWPSAEGLPDDYNSNSRNYIGIAHLDGVHPFIIVVRGLYMTQKIWAYDSELNRAWERKIGEYNVNPWLLKAARWDLANRVLRRLFGYNITQPKIHRGSHNLPIADLNLDGREEILWGEHCLGEGGKDVWVVADHMPYNGHPDVVFPADIVPDIEGLEVFYGREGWAGPDDGIGVLLVDKDGKQLWAHWGYRHIDGGWAAKIIPGLAGMQLFAYDIRGKKFTDEGVALGNVEGYLWASNGDLKETNDWYWSFPLDWDGDGIDEIFTRDGMIKRHDGTLISTFSAGGLWAADIFGDHRDELVLASGGSTIHIVFNTSPLKTQPRLTALADRKYRNDLSRTAMGDSTPPGESGVIAIK
jgi:rhamnogalacturonan endolyase